MCKREIEIDRQREKESEGEFNAMTTQTLLYYKHQLSLQFIFFLIS